jgi:hypothetical protein
MRRLLAASLTLTVMMAGVTPCAARPIIKPLSEHDCCPPKQDMSSATDAAAPIVAASPVDCCVVMPDGQPAADVPTVKSPVKNPNVLAAMAATFRLNAGSVPAPRTIDRRGRSSPRPPLVTVLLI